MYKQTCSAVLVTLVILAGCQNREGEKPKEPTVSTVSEHEATSLLGEPLYRATFDTDQLARLEQNYNDAREEWELEPDSAESWIWLGRRAGYLWRYGEAIEIFTAGMERFPDDARLLRHRGHRYISVREFESAIADLEKAASMIDGTEDTVEPDGAPNAAGIPTSTLHTNIWYHLGLAYYLTGNFSAAIESFENCLAASRNNDMMVATVDWLYMSLRREGRHSEAAQLLDTVGTDLELLENHAYYRRVLMYKGLLDPTVLLDPEDDTDRSLNLATQGYGVGNWYLYNGDSLRAYKIFEDVLAGDYWPAFGYIAAEAEMARRKNAKVSDGS